MMRSVRGALVAALALAGSLTVAGSLAVAQEGAAPATPPAPPGPAPLRVSIALTSQMDGQASPKNVFLYYLWERLTFFGLRAECTTPVGDERLDRFVQAKAAKWEREQPGAAPASLQIVGSAGATYSNAEFFGQTQAHSFKGAVDVALKAADGTEVCRVAFEHSWGQLPQNKTRAQTQQEYDQMTHTAVVLALLSRPEVQAGVPAAKKAELAAFITQQRQRLLQPLEANAMSDCALAQLLKALPEPPK